MTDDTVPVFRALADANRRVLLDRLFERDGQTLGELCEHLPGMTRFGVMKHLGVLEEADLVTTLQVGREKRHFLNPVPIRLVHDRWIGKFAEPVVGAMSTLKRLLETPMDRVDHIYSILIKAAPERVWQAITDGDDTVRYYYDTRVASTWQAGAPLTYTYPDGGIAADGEVVEIEPGRSVTMSFHPRWRPDIDAEGPIRMTWLVEPAERGGTKLTVTSGLIPGSQTAVEFADGIVYIVSGLKTFLETGEGMARLRPSRLAPGAAHGRRSRRVRSVAKTYPWDLPHLVDATNENGTILPGNIPATRTMIGPPTRPDRRPAIVAIALRPVRARTGRVDRIAPRERGGGPAR